MQGIFPGNVIDEVKLYPSTATNILLRLSVCLPFCVLVWLSV